MTPAATRHALLEQLASIWERFPELRFGQLVASLTDDMNIPIPIIEDDELLAAATDFTARASRVPADCPETQLAAADA